MSDVRSIQFGREINSEADVDEVRSWLPAQATNRSKLVGLRRSLMRATCQRVKHSGCGCSGFTTHFKRTRDQMNADFIEQRANSDDSNKSAKPSAKKGRGSHPN